MPMLLLNKLTISRLVLSAAQLNVRLPSKPVAGTNDAKPKVEISG
jgi:hypothetical protein